MPGVLVNIDVPDIEAGIAFYTQALGLDLARRLDGEIVELRGVEVSLFLLQKSEGSSIGPAGGDERRYRRHWSPIHLDFTVDDLDAAIASALAAGARQEGEPFDLPYGRQAMFADPFGHGFCLIQFNEKGYDAYLA